jgi:hypothetical protein
MSSKEVPKIENKFCCFECKMTYPNKRFEVLNKDFCKISCLQTFKQRVDEEKKKKEDERESKTIPYQSFSCGGVC